MISLTTNTAVLLATAKHMPWAQLIIAVLMPTTSPVVVTSGPPELPGLSAASVWDDIVDEAKIKGAPRCFTHRGPAQSRFGKSSEAKLWLWVPSEVDITDATRELIVSLSVRNTKSLKSRSTARPKALVHNDRRDTCRSGSEARRVKLRYRSPSLETSVTYASYAFWVQRV